MIDQLQRTAMKAPLLTLLLILSSILCLSRGALGIHNPGGSDGNRRVLHQPLYPVDSTPPPAGEPPPPVFPGPDEPFFPEVPTGQSPDQTQTSPPAPPANVSLPVTPATAAQPTSPTKKVAIAVSVGVVTLGMLSAFAFFLYRHRVRHPPESQKLIAVGDENNSQRFAQVPTGPASDFLYLGTMEPSDRRGGDARAGVGEEPNGICGSPYHKLSSMRISELHRPSPELHPLPPLSRAPPCRTSPPPLPPPQAMSSDEETFYYTPQGSVAGNGNGNGNGNSSNGKSPCVPWTDKSPKRRGSENRMTVARWSENRTPVGRWSKNCTPKGSSQAGSLLLGLGLLLFV